MSGLLFLGAMFGVSVYFVTGMIKILLSGEWWETLFVITFYASVIYYFVS